MILLDFSAMMHQCIFSSVSQCKPKTDDNDQYITDDFIKYTKHYMLDTLFNIQNDFYIYGDIVICLDDYSTQNWRKSIHQTYKGSRKSNREKSQIKYNEVFSHMDEFIDNLRENSPWKVVRTSAAEGDDVILILAKHFAKREKVLIISSDKDMIQAQKFGDVQQYSLFTRKFIKPETKHSESIDAWLLEHVIFGDSADEVPRIIDDTKYSQEFIKFLDEEKLKLSPLEFHELDVDKQHKLNESFKLSKFYKPTLVKSRKTKSNDGGLVEKYPEIFISERFGKSSLNKKIEEFGSIDNWIDSNPLYRKNFIRNQKLVLAEYIPENIQKAIIKDFNDAKSTYNQSKFNEYLKKYSIQSVMVNAPNNFVGQISFI